MNNDEVVEQRRKVAQQELECWITVRDRLKERIMSGIDEGASSVLSYVQALEIAVNAEARALEQVSLANTTYSMGE